MCDTITAVILAGGKSQRMGKDKALLQFKEFTTLSQYQYEKLSKIFSHVYLSSKNEKFHFLQDNSKIILDTNEGYSPMIALKTIFETLQTPQIFILPVDTPFISSETIQKLLFCHTNNSAKITVAQDYSKKIHYLCGVFDHSILEEIQECLNHDIHTIHTLLHQVGFETVCFENEQEFFNINTPVQYYQSLLRDFS